VIPPAPVRSSRLSRSRSRASSGHVRPGNARSHIRIRSAWRGKGKVTLNRRRRVKARSSAVGNVGRQDREAAVRLHPLQQEVHPRCLAVPVVRVLHLGSRRAEIARRPSSKEEDDGRPPQRPSNNRLRFLLGLPDVLAHHARQVDPVQVPGAGRSRPLRRPCSWPVPLSPLNRGGGCPGPRFHPVAENPSPRTRSRRWGHLGAQTCRRQGQFSVSGSTREVPGGPVGRTRWATDSSRGPQLLTGPGPTACAASGRVPPARPARRTTEADGVACPGRTDPPAAPMSVLRVLAQGLPPGLRAARQWSGWATSKTWLGTGRSEADGPRPPSISRPPAWRLRNAGSTGSAPGRLVAVVLVRGKRATGASTDSRLTRAVRFRSISAYPAGSRARPPAGKRSLSDGVGHSATATAVGASRAGHRPAAPAGAGPPGGRTHQRRRRPDSGHRAAGGRAGSGNGLRGRIGLQHCWPDARPDGRVP